MNVVCQDKDKLMMDMMLIWFEKLWRAYKKRSRGCSFASRQDSARLHSVDWQDSARLHSVDWQDSARLHSVDWQDSARLHSVDWQDSARLHSVDWQDSARLHSVDWQDSARLHSVDWQESLPQSQTNHEQMFMTASFTSQYSDEACAGMTVAGMMLQIARVRHHMLGWQGKRAEFERETGRSSSICWRD